MQRAFARAGRANLAFALVALLHGTALAAPFCETVQGLPDQCIYVDGAECGRRAQRDGGVCTTNQAEVTTPPGPGQFCLVESGRVVMCVYADRDTCQKEADRRHSACVPVTPTQQGGVDPFAVRRPY